MKSASGIQIPPRAFIYTREATASAPNSPRAFICPRAAANAVNAPNSPRVFIYPRVTASAASAFAPSSIQGRRRTRQARRTALAHSSVQGRRRTQRTPSRIHLSKGSGERGERAECLRAFICPKAAANASNALASSAVQRQRQARRTPSRLHLSKGSGKRVEQPSRIHLSRVTMASMPNTLAYSSVQGRRRRVCKYAKRPRVKRASARKKRPGSGGPDRVLRVGGRSGRARPGFCHGCAVRNIVMTVE